jgi:hypothetical protein
MGRYGEIWGDIGSTYDDGHRVEVRDAPRVRVRVGVRVGVGVGVGVRVNLTLTVISST